jgi:hypothetical protein
MKYKACIRAALALVILGGPATLPAADKPHIRTVEAALELPLSAVVWPSEAVGLVTMATCRSGCASRSFRYTSRTTALWNGAVVPLQTVRDKARSRPTRATTVVYDRETSEILRIIGHD